MKLVFAIVGNDDAHIVIPELMREGFSATKLASSGGFLHAGNVTFMIGVEDGRLDGLKELLGSFCKKRKQIVPVSYGEGFSAGVPAEVTVGGATLFVLDVDSFEKL